MSAPPILLYESYPRRNHTPRGSLSPLLSRKNVLRALVAAAFVFIMTQVFLLAPSPSHHDSDRHLPLHRQAAPAPIRNSGKVQEHRQLLRTLTHKKLTAEEEKEKKLGYDRNAFNQFISDQLPLDREFADARDPLCQEERYHPNEILPKTSVIIIFHNEAVSTLLRTAYSAYHQSPPELIEEILLVDDASTGDWLQNIEEEIAKIPKARYHRLHERSGLIRAKVEGAKIARGEVLTFLDSHCECNPGWLQPLLDRVKLDRRTVAVPVIDVLDKDTFEYKTALYPSQRGVFSWHLQFAWLDLPAKTKHRLPSKVSPFPSPTMAGGLFAMERRFFFEVGSYDLGMETWGGENLEMSFRIWMCGGRIEGVPCSRVGHVFRSRNPVSFKDKNPTTTIAHNLNRVAEVWMDEYKDIYYNITKNKRLGAGDVSERAQLRKDLSCKSFKWYLDEIYPDLFAPLPENFYKMGRIKNEATGLCLDAKTTHVDTTSPVTLTSCNVAYSPFFWTKNPKDTIRQERNFGEMCLNVKEMSAGSPLVMKACLERREEDHGKNRWTLKPTGQLVHVATGLCVEARSTGDSKSLVVDGCKRQNPRQKWTFVGQQHL